MPKTKFQDFVFTIVMVFVMVYFMSLFNTAYALGGLTNDMFLSTLIEMPITYLFVLALELLLVGRVAPKIAFKLVNPSQTQPILITVVVLSILFYRPFCKWICPLGAIYSLFNKVSLLNIKVEDSKCIGCGQCSKVCKMDVDVCKHPDHPECIRCGACIKACPKDAIHYRFMGK